ncbi:MAG TPA: GGDEF domain-containing protein [Acidimicrobiales bacterium]|nr:GGDEF domain-containing protein [Acidimicrobiales bacterium]
MFLRRPLRELLFDPAAAATFFWLGGVAGAAVMLLTSHWPRDAVVTTLVVMAIALTATLVRRLVGERQPAWTLQVDAALATGLVSVVLAVAPYGYNAFAIFYVWIALYSSLYFTRRQTVLQIVLVAGAYALVLANGPAVDRPYASWLAVVGTCATFAGLTSTLVNVLRTTARQDSLTGVANRRVFDERLAEEIERARRSRVPLSVIALDVDDFKGVNDHRGHLAGDRTLVRLVEGWRACLRRATDFLARLGGDEFAAIVLDADADQVRQLVERLGAVTADGATASVGTATWDGAESAEDLFRRADAAMFEAKAVRKARRAP